MIMTGLGRTSKEEKIDINFRVNGGLWQISSENIFDEF